MSRSFVASHFPTSPVVPIGFIVLGFPVILPALPLFSFLSLSRPFQFPFDSLSFPVAFLTCRLPISSPHFLALPCISPLLPSILHFPFAPQYFPQKNTRFFPAFWQRGRPTTQSFSRFSAKGSRKPKPAKSRQGESSLEPLFCDTGSTFSETSSNRRARGPPPLSDVRRGGGGYPLF